MVVNEEEQQPNASSSSKFPLSASDGQQAAGDAEEDAVNPALLEKQLWAIHTSLTEEITDEKRQVARLLTILREVAIIIYFSRIFTFITRICIYMYVIS